MLLITIRVEGKILEVVTYIGEVIVLFNSFEFIFVFLPIAFLIYFLLIRIHPTVGKLWLLASSLFFYSWWNPIYLPLIIASLIVNYSIGSLLGKKTEKVFVKKALLTIGIIFNVGLIAYFKYSDFFIVNINTIFSTDLNLLRLALPLAISFYTFQQIAYLVDSYRHETKSYNFLNYCLFVTFFPQLIAGPIVQHKEIMPQLLANNNKKIDFSNIAAGIFIFSIGLFKKLIIADTFAVWANKGYESPATLQFIDAWLASLSYTFQLYFDFSGYTDMAIGAALLFNIKLPINFNSPYKALNIQDFWKRWHITLTKFLTSYIYIPLGGNRKGKVRTYVNILIIFFISGLWHGAGWTFIIWGTMHGLATVIHRYWSSLGFKMNKLLAWFITFNFINFTWVLFRAESLTDAVTVMKGMLGFHGFSLPAGFQKLNVLQELPLQFHEFQLSDDLTKTVAYTIVFFGICVFAKNSIQMMVNFKPNFRYALFIAFLFVYSVYNLQKISEFLYFNF